MEISLPLFRKYCASKAPVEENAQDDPHFPWYLTIVTAPFLRQSIDSGHSTFSGLIKVASVSDVLQSKKNMYYCL